MTNTTQLYEIGNNNVNTNRILVFIFISIIILFFTFLCFLLLSSYLCKYQNRVRPEVINY